MPSVIAISSFVAASRVGLGIFAPAVQAFATEVIAVPTVAYGRHPGWGAPGGVAFSGGQLKDMLKGALAHPDAARCSWAATGYFASADQIKAAAEAIGELKKSVGDLKVLVDPIMGDEESGLYVAKDVPGALEKHLLPLADMLAPNAWEAQLLAKTPADDPAGAVKAARALGKPAVVSSVRRGERIGAVYADARQAWYAHAPQRAHAPHGTGDLLAGAFLGALVTKMAESHALATAVRMVDFALDVAGSGARKLDELPAVVLRVMSVNWPPAVPKGAVELERLEA